MTRYGRDAALTARRLLYALGLALVEAGLGALVWKLTDADPDLGRALLTSGASPISDWIMTPIVIVMAFVGMGSLALFFMAGFMSGAGECPSCHARLTDLDRGDFLDTCSRCGIYLEGKKGELSVVPDDFVAATPELRTAMPAGDPKWPRRPDGELACCVCGARARLVPVAWVAYVRDVGSQRTRSVDHKTDVPHCGEHRDGASFSDHPGGKSVVVRFRSLSFLKSFCAENGTRVGG